MDSEQYNCQFHYSENILNENCYTSISSYLNLREEIRNGVINWNN